MSVPAYILRILLNPTHPNSNNDATGAKLRKTTYANNILQETRDYVNGVEYKNGIVDRFSHTEGAVVRQSDGTTFLHEYSIKDHLGNTRVTYSDANNDGVIAVADIKQINHYYPFGMNMEGNWNGAAGSNKYQYNSKEWNDDFGLGLNDYGARFYDPSVSRWLSPDPLAAKYNRVSPYCYALNSPINVIDPDGRDVMILYKDEDGKEQKQTYKYEKNRKMDDKMSKSFLGKTIAALDKIASKTNGNNLVQGLVDNKGTTNIKETKDSKNTTQYNSETETTVNFNPNLEQKVPTLNADGSESAQGTDPFIALGHELGHSEDHFDGTPVHLDDIWIPIKDSKGRDYSISGTELYSTHRENQIRSENNTGLRTHYGATSKGPIEATRLINSKTRESLYFDSNSKTDCSQPQKPYKYE